MTVFVPNGQNQGITATWLLYSADENDIDRRSIKTTRGGFNIPDELAEAMGLVETSNVSFVAAVPEVPEITKPEPEVKTPPPGWDDPLPEPDVYLDADGKVYLTDDAQARETGEEPEAPSVEHVAEEVDREDIRAWAKEQGFQVAERGALKKAVIEAYHEAHKED